MSRKRKVADYKADDYKGQAKELDTLRNSAPLEQIEEPLVPTQARQPAPSNLGGFVQDVTAPEQDPMVSPLAGTQDGFNRFNAAPDANMILQAMYKVLPSKEIAALLKDL